MQREEKDVTAALIGGGPKAGKSSCDSPSQRAQNDKLGAVEAHSCQAPSRRTAANGSQQVRNGKLDGTVSRIGQAIFEEGILPVFHKTRGTTLCWPALAALSRLLAQSRVDWAGVSTSQSVATGWSVH